MDELFEIFHEQNSVWWRYLCDAMVVLFALADSFFVVAKVKHFIGNSENLFFS